MGKKDRRAEIPDKKARKNAAAAKEEEAAKKEVPKIKGCHVSVDVCGGCIRPKDKVPEANSADGVKMACSNHHCPFAQAFSVHKDCFQKLTDKVVSMLLRTGSSSWTDEQRVENAWRRKGLTFVGKFISCPCGHGTQTLEDSENRWSRVGEVVLDPKAYEKNREEKIKKALVKQVDKPVPTQPKSLNATFGGKEQAALERKLARLEWAKENGFTKGEGSGAGSISFPSTSTSTAAKKPKTSPPSVLTSAFASPISLDDDGFTTIGKDGRARETTPTSPSPFVSAAAPIDRKAIQPLRSIVCPPPNFTAMAAARAERGRTISSGSNTSWLTSSTIPQQQQQPQREKRRGGAGGGQGRTGAAAGGGGRTTDRNKENQRQRDSSRAPKKSRAFSLLSGSEDEEEEEERMESPNLQPAMKNMRDFVDEFHSYSGIGYWSESEVKEINQHLALFKTDSARFECRITGRKLREPTLLTQLTPATAWIFTTQAMSFKRADIPPGTQLTLQEYYAIFHDYEVKHLTDPIIWCRDGTQAVLECSEMTMLTMGR